MRGRIFNVHVRRATMGGLALENTHPFCLGQLLVRPQRHDPALPAPARARHAPAPTGDTDSEHFFNFLMHDFDAGDPVALAAHGRCAGRSSARRSAGSTSCSPTASSCSPTGSACSSCTGCPAGPAAGGLGARHRRAAGTASSRTCCSTLDPDDLEEPHAERLLGDELVGRRRDPEGRRAAPTCAARSAARSPRERAAAAAAGRASERAASRCSSTRRGRGPGAEGAAGGPRRAGRLERAAPHGRPRAASSTPTRRPPGRRGGRDGRGARRRRAAAPAGAARSKSTGSALAIIPCGRGNDLARVLGIPDRPGRGRRGSPSSGDERLMDVADVDGKPYMGIASFGFDSDANRIANEAKLVKGNAVYLYAALRALAAWKPARFTRDRRRRAPRVHAATRWPSATRRPTAAACSSLPDAELDDGQLDVMIVERGRRSSASCATLPEGLQGHARGHADVAVPARRGDRGERRPPVRHLRRRRPDRATCPATVARRAPLRCA